MQDNGAFAVLFVVAAVLAVCWSVAATHTTKLVRQSGSRESTPLIFWLAAAVPTIVVTIVGFLALVNDAPTEWPVWIQWAVLIIGWVFLFSSAVLTITAASYNKHVAREARANQRVYGDPTL